MISCVNPPLCSLVSSQYRGYIYIHLHPRCSSLYSCLTALTEPGFSLDSVFPAKLTRSCELDSHHLTCGPQSTTYIFVHFYPVITALDEVIVHGILSTSIPSSQLWAKSLSTGLSPLLTGLTPPSFNLRESQSFCGDQFSRSTTLGAVFLYKVRFSETITKSQTSSLRPGMARYTTQYRS